MNRVITIPAFSDNYIYLYQYDKEKAFVVDPADSSAVLRVLKEKGLTLTMILCTHAHYDHVGGNGELKKKTGCEVIGPDAGRIPDIDRVVRDGDIISTGTEQIHVIASPGHTDKDVCYYLPASVDNPHGVVFTGDTMFVAGCGRLLGTDALTMFDSLKKLADLPPETRVYCGHEYTIEDSQFALTVEPTNETVKKLLLKANEAVGARRPTVPSTIGQEKWTNPFLRTDSVEIRQRLNMTKAEPWEVFAELRRRKDIF